MGAVQEKGRGLMLIEHQLCSGYFIGLISVRLEKVRLGEAKSYVRTK